MSFRNALITASSVALYVLPCVALAHEGDIGLRLVDNRLTTVLAEGEPPAQTIGLDENRVFAAELAYSAPTSQVTINEPGFATDEAGLINQNVGMYFRKALRAWDGSTFTATSMTMSVGSYDLLLPFVSTPLSDASAPKLAQSFPIQPDFHFDWTLDGATELTGQGIYLVELELESSSSAFSKSRPFWLVYNYGMSEGEHENAVAWVESNLVPAPGAAGLLALGTLVASRRRRA